MISSKRKLLLLLSAGALIALTAWTQTWFVFVMSEGVALSDVAVAGTESRPLVSALSFGALAAVGALLLAGPVVRRIILVASFFIGVAGLVSTVTAMTNPVVAAIGSLSSVTGVVDLAAVQQSVTTTSLTLWPWVTACGFLLLVVVSALGAFTAGQWSRPTERFNRPEFDGNLSHDHTNEITEGDSWDSLSRGEDPTR